MNYLLAIEEKATTCSWINDRQQWQIQLHGPADDCSVIVANSVKHMVCYRH